MEKRDLETNARQNPYLAGLAPDRAHVRLGSDRHPRRPQRTDALTPEILHGIFKKYFSMDRYTVVTLKPEG